MTERLPPPDVERFPPLAQAHLRVLAANTLLGRIYCRAGAHPTTWRTFRHVGPTTSRFDHHRAGPPTHDPERAILYAVPAVRLARSMPVLRTALSECFADRGVIELRRDQPWFALFHLERPLRLLDVVDSTWITRAGGNGPISSGPRATSRAWARAIHERYDVDGVYYGCATIPAARAVALFERARDALPPRVALNRPLSDPVLRPEIETYAFRDLGLELVP